MAKTITRQIDQWDVDSFEGGLEKLIVNLTDVWLKAQADGYTAVYLQYDGGYDYERAHYTFTGSRPETAKEIAAREAKTARQKVLNRKSKAVAKQKKEAADRATYERLKAKYG